MMPLTWKVKETSQYGHITRFAYSGEIVVFSISWGLSGKYELKCRLPGFKVDLGEFGTVEEPQRRAEQVFSAWLEKAGLVEKDAAK